MHIHRRPVHEGLRIMLSKLGACVWRGRQFVLRENGVNSLMPFAHFNVKATIGPRSRAIPSLASKAVTNELSRDGAVHEISSRTHS